MIPHARPSGATRFAIALVLMLMRPADEPIGAAEPLQRPAARWIGQDGNDLVGPSSTPGPSDVQDVHITVGGLPRGRKIARARLVADGGGEWMFEGPFGPWRLEVTQPPNSDRADVFFEPAQVETGRLFTLFLTFDDGRELTIPLAGGGADPNKRMPSAALKLRWIGQEGHDWTSPGPGVGPDGLVDARLSLEGLSPRIAITEVAVEGAGLTGWRSGTNPEGRHDAYLSRDEGNPSRADLWISPEADLRGRALDVTVTYANGKTDRATVTAGATDSRRAVQPDPLPRIEAGRIAVQWLGQDGANASRPADAHLVVSGIPANRRIVAVGLSGGARGGWFQTLDARARIEPEPGASPLEFRRRGNDATRADLFFLPARDESGSSMTLSLIDDGGSMSLTAFPGGAGDAARLADRGVPRTPLTVTPGADIVRLLARPAHLRLARGTHRLTDPLVIRHPTRITAEPGAVLEFDPTSQRSSWSEAISIRSGGVHLEGFAVRFRAPVTWEASTGGGPAAIGWSAPEVENVPQRGVALVGLDLESDPVRDAKAWSEAVRLVRLQGGQGGRIEGCTLRGGTVEVWSGPWRIAGNRSLGTPPATFTPAVFAGHETHDLVIENNQVEPSADSGKVWRFLVLTDNGYRDKVVGNVVRGVGPRDGDTIPNMNAPEIILTESYRLRYEGRVLDRSADGRLIRIGTPQGGAPRVGDVMAVLRGPASGSWSRITFVIDPTVFAIEPPLPPGDHDVSIGPGFIEETFRGNTIEARGGSGAVHLVLAGQHFGTRVAENRFVGAGGVFKITACPTESPVHWGWSHAPMFGLVIEGNTLIDPLHGGLIAVEHGAPIKSNRGRVYLTAGLHDNTLAGTREFSTTWRGRDQSAPRPIDLAQPGGLDPDEQRVGTKDNRVEGDPPFRPEAAVNEARKH